MLGVLAALGLCAASGCERTEPTTPSSPSNANPPRATNPPPSAKPPKDADNTARNAGDHEAGAKTPMDQGQSAQDVRITAEIRKLIMDDKVMSMNAQNCKIITLNGAVTLRGPVESQSEREAIVMKAKSVAGVTVVDDQLEVKAK
jgi:hypothetical protein